MIQFFYELLQKQKRWVIGLMSGTSVDGVDVALVEITGSGLNTEIELIAFETVPYSSDVRARIFSLFDAETARVDEICTMNFVLGRLFADSVKTVLKKTGIATTQVDLIGSHGQTIQHLPEGTPRSTLQIGEPAVIAHETGIPTVADFRVADVAAGGEGAPLVAYPDYLLFRHPTETIGLLNIGGIANLTVLPAGCSVAEVVASDTGPGNMLIDACVVSITDGKKQFDEDGALARQGTVCEDLLKTWMARPFFGLTPPKTTGREMFGAAFAKTCLQQIQNSGKAARSSGISANDGLATLTALTVESIAHHYREFVAKDSPIDILYVSGGGAQNTLMMQWLAEAFSPVPVVDVTEKGISGDAKEAIAFAILANETVHGNFSNVPNATGASTFKVLGKFVLP